MAIPVGRKVTVRVPGSSANLGPGFDTLGLALSIYDVVEIEVIDDGLIVEVYGEGEGELPLDASHLVVKACIATLAAAGETAPGLKVVCHNTIPQSRGLGSSAAAATAGVIAGHALAGEVFSTDQLVQLAAEYEGHPDNSSASVLGHAVVSWTDTQGEHPQYHAVTLPVHPEIQATAFVPNFHASTAEIRKVLPSNVSHVDARFNAARSALLTVALQHDPSLLMAATEDRLHQPYRAEVLATTTKWVKTLREAGYAAFVSGAGPTCLALSTEPVRPDLIQAAQDEGLAVFALTVADPVHYEVTDVNSAHA